MQVFYKNQLELEERKKKALDKQLDFLLGQTERYYHLLSVGFVLELSYFLVSSSLHAHSLLFCANFF